MSAAFFPALLALQVFNVYGASLVLNVAVGESILLPTEVKGPVKGSGFMRWTKNNNDLIILAIGEQNATFKTTVINENADGRLIMNNETGALSISRLRKEDSGIYEFDGLISSEPLTPKTIQLQVYEIQSSPYIYIAAGGGGLLLVMIVIILTVIIRKKSKRGAAQEELTVYAEVGENTQQSSVCSRPSDPAHVSSLYDVITDRGTTAAPTTVYDIVKFERATATQYQEVL